MTKLNGQADAIVRVTFLKTEEGGREGPTRPDFFGCPLALYGKFYDCRLLLEENGPLHPGDTATVLIKFLDPASIHGFLEEELRFQLWEGRVVAEGVVLKVLLDPANGG